MKKRVGVFVCHCGLNIAASVDVEKVVEAMRAYPGVVQHDRALVIRPGVLAPELDTVGSATRIAQTLSVVHPPPALTGRLSVCVPNLERAEQAELHA